MMRCPYCGRNLPAQMFYDRNNRYCYKNGCRCGFGLITKMAGLSSRDVVNGRHLEVKNVKDK